MNDLTVIYYTSNRENEAFEEKIRERLLKSCGNLPIVSVSQKPLSFGQNICLANLGFSNTCLYTQLLIGAKTAKTSFIITAESDFLYPPEYFSFRPKLMNKIYRYANIRILYRHHYGFLHKKMSEGAQIVGREYLISLLEERLKNTAMDNTKFNPYKYISYEFYGGDPACVSFKTGDSLHKYVEVEREKSIPELPHWGKAEDLRKEFELI